MIIGRFLMVQLVLVSNFKRGFLEWDNCVVNMRDPVLQPSQAYTSKCEEEKVLM